MSAEANFTIGDRVRILTINKSEYIGYVECINETLVILHVTICPDWVELKTVFMAEIYKMRRAEPWETFDVLPYFDAEEKEFWRTHWHTRDGIKEKTPEDIKMLEEFFEKWK